MSRGLGKSQRLILDTLQEHGAYFLVALADGDTGSKYQSLYRAAMRLQEQERIKITTFGGRPRVAIQHPGPRADLDQALETTVVIAKGLGQDDRAFRYWCDLEDEGRERTRELVEADRIIAAKRAAELAKWQEAKP